MGLENILDSTTKINVLRILTNNPNADFYGSELAKMVGVSQSAISQQIKILVKEKLVNETKRGKMKFYKIRKTEKSKAIKRLLKIWEKV